MPETEKKKSGKRKHAEKEDATTKKSKTTEEVAPVATAAAVASPSTKKSSSEKKKKDKSAEKAAPASPAPVVKEEKKSESKKHKSSESSGEKRKAEKGDESEKPKKKKSKKSSSSSSSADTLGALLGQLDTKVFLAQLHTLSSAISTLSASLHTAAGLTPEAEAAPVAAAAEEPAKDGKRGRHTWTADEDAKVLTERAAGRAFRDIGKDLGLPASKIRSHYEYLMKDSKSKDAPASPALKKEAKSAPTPAKSGATPKKAPVVEDSESDDSESDEDSD